MKRIARSALLASAVMAPAMVVPFGSVAFAQTATRSFSIAAQDLGDALRQFATQSGRDVVFDPAIAEGKTSKAVQGTMSDEAALRQLTSDSGLNFKTTSNGFAVTLGNGAAVAEQSSDSAGISEILVVGSRSQNVDIRRTNDDILPYVVIDSKQIEQAGATSLEDFLKTRLPMNAQTIDTRQNTQSPGTSQGAIDLRGLGYTQTLILVDGRRIADALTPGLGFQQPNINGIPLASIDRIDVLPSSAGAIYGGNAVGGVINIVRKHNYQGLDVYARLGESFRGDVNDFEIGLVGGKSFNGGRTQLNLSLSYSDSSDTLLISERSFGERARAMVEANAPDVIAGLSAPPISTTANICAAFVFSETEGLCSQSTLTLRSGTSIPGGFTHVSPGYAGPSSDNGSGLANNAGQYNLLLPESREWLLRAPRRVSGTLDVRQEVASWISAFGSLSYEKGNTDLTFGHSAAYLGFTADDPLNPFNEDVFVSVGLPGLNRPADEKSRRITTNVGLILRLAPKWSANIEGGWAQSRLLYRYSNASPISEEGLAILRQHAFEDISQLDLRPYYLRDFTSLNGPFITNLKNVSARVSGALFALPGGDLKLTSLVEARDQVAKRTFSDQLLDDGSHRFTLYPKRTQRVYSAYAEILAPLVSSKQDVPFVHSLDLQGSIRYDDYRTIGTAGTTPSLGSPSKNGPFPPFEYVTSKLRSVNWLAGLRYEPFEGLTFRGSVATGFLPPNLYQISSIVQSLRGGQPTDPMRGNQRVSRGIPVVTGGNPDLEPERSKTLSLGIIAKPRFAPGLRLSVDYSEIRKRDEISGGTLQYILLHEGDYPGRVTRGPRLPTDDPSWAGPVTAIDDSLFNLLKSKYKMLDFQLGYRREVPWIGIVDFSMVATHPLKFVRQPTPTAAPYDSVGFSGGPLPWKGVGNLTLDSGPWTFGWSAQYYSKYHITINNPDLISYNDFLLSIQGTDHIRSQMYHDLFVRYRTGKSRGDLLKDTEFSLIVENLFDRSPPVIAPSDIDDISNSYSTYGDPRLRRFTVSVRKSFGK